MSAEIQFDKPAVGAIVRVKVRSRSHYYYRTADWTEEEYEGTVLPAAKWTRDTAFVLATPQFDRMPVRDIPLHDVVDLQYLNGAAATKSTVSSDVQTWSVAGSKGSNYTVTRQAGKYSCTCAGFGFRRHCKHVDSVKS